MHASHRPARPTVPTRVRHAAVLLAAVWLCHWPLLRAPFLADDEALAVAARQRVRQGRALEYLKPTYWREEHAATKGLYRPVREMVLGHVTVRWGLRPRIFHALNLARIDPTECIKSLKGLVAGPMSDIAPVQPILQLDKEDSRFVESQEVLAELNSTTNLAEIGWEEFEHLVRELFGEMFSEGDAEVKVTQTSSDGGVDAIAFDPDPIRGGKFVIQAKRYTKVVPVSAVRDLYGTMISEGATKGILVTTAHFGRDTREFVKDKPISLIDGSNLVYLLEQHGHKVRIDIKAARSKRGRDPLKR